MLLSAGNEKPFQRLNFHDTGALHHKTVYPQPVEELLEKERIGNHDCLCIPDLFNDFFSTLDDSLSGFDLTRVCMLSLSSGFPLPCFRRVLSVCIGEGTERNFIQKRVDYRGTREQNLICSILRRHAFSPQDLFSVGVISPPVIREDCRFQLSMHSSVKTGRRIGALYGFFRLADTDNGKAHSGILICFCLFRNYFRINRSSPR
jgi:hypothetical protein